jgi:inosine-uridine nucleoside N-ribohydrolase
MGGGTFGNRSSTAEFNIWADPEAAHIVFSSGVRIIMAGLDVTHQFTATPDRIAAIRATDGLLGTTLADLLTFFSAQYGELHDDGAFIGGAIHDPLAVLALSHPHLFERVARHVVVEIRGEHTRGMTVIDQRKVTERQTPNCDMLTSVDAAAVFDVTLEAIAHFSG